MNQSIRRTSCLAVLGTFLSLSLGCQESEQEIVAAKLEAVGGVADADGRKDGRVVRITLRGMEVTDDQLDHVVGLERLAHLYLDDSGITNDGIKKISDSSTIEFLSLRNTSIDDTCVEAISRMKSLKFLYVSETNLTSRGIRKLQKALPNTRIMD